MVLILLSSILFPSISLVIELVNYRVINVSQAVDDAAEEDAGLDDIAHGGVPGLGDHASECEVAEIVYLDN